MKTLITKYGTKNNKKNIVTQIWFSYFIKYRKNLTTSIIKHSKKTMIILSIIISRGTVTSYSFGYNTSNDSYQPKELFCFDNKDNDHDGYIDCQDNDCFEEGYCNPKERACNDNKDNDNDGTIDCLDSDCISSKYCPGEKKHFAPKKEIRHEKECNNNYDDDNDSLIDCADLDCFFTASCNEDIKDEINCHDYIDNNNNGKIDCEEDTCLNSNYCEKNIETSCNDGFDNDGDGQIDCEDTNCKQTQICPITENICNDNIDNDNDGQVDCLDTDCNIQCKGEICYDSIDNDSDGQVDCLDIDCNGSPSSSGICYRGFEKDCSDGFDNDQDGLTDCEDSDCKHQSQCSSICGNKIIEKGEECDDGNNSNNDGCTDCQRETPNCDTSIHIDNQSIRITTPYKRFKTKKLKVNNHKLTDFFVSETINITQTGKYSLTWDAYNHHKNKKCNKEIIINTIQGCTDPHAINYNNNANYDDGSCKYSSIGFDCNVLELHQEKTIDGIHYSRNGAVMRNNIKELSIITTTNKITLSKERNEITIGGIGNTEKKIFQVIKKEGEILSCTIQ